MNILMVASEANPLYKSGGLADVIYALSKQFAKIGNNVSICVPYYTQVGKQQLIHAEPLCKIIVKMNWRNIESEIYTQDIDGIHYFLIKNNTYFGRNALYGFFDDGERFAFFSNAVIELMKKLPFKIDILHVHDWQAGMIPCLVKTLHQKELIFKNVKTVLTIHNPLFKGYFNETGLYDLYNLPIYIYQNGSVRFNDQVSTLKAAIHYADKITTVSPTHAWELTTPEGSDGLYYEMILRKDDFSGILNGMDYGEFNPKKDLLIYKDYDVNDFEIGKKINKEAFCKEHNLDSKRPLFAVVSRLTSQKGLYLMNSMAEFVTNNGGIFAVLGSGEKSSEDHFNDLLRRKPQNTFVYIGYSDPIAHKLYAASDFFIMPSMIEPCGLGQMIAQRYGSLPIVRRTGGLKDSVIPYSIDKMNISEADGFGFDNMDITEAIGVTATAFGVYNNKVLFKKLIRNAMKRDNTWGKSANQYLMVYEEAMKK